jgi:hypothetical protein
MTMVAFESISRFLLFLHHVGAIVALATSIHLVIRASTALFSRGYIKQARLHALILAVSYAATFVLGMLVYPTFRIRIRYEWLDAAAPHATALFEAKEHLAALGLVPAIGLYMLTRVLDLNDEADRQYRSLFLVMNLFVAAVLLFNGGAGWYIATLRAL